MADNYKNAVLCEHRGFLEHKCAHCKHFIRKPRVKDRVITRAMKRSARQLDKKELDNER